MVDLNLRMMESIEAMMVMQLIQAAVGAPGEATYQFPVAASTHADAVDTLYYFAYWVSTAAFVIITGLMGYFIWKYRAAKLTDKAQSQMSHSTSLEVAWTIPPALFGLIVFYFGALGYADMRTPPDDAYSITVNAYKWAWVFRYPEGAESNDLHVPVDTPVRLVMYSDDVLHSLFVPAFRIKQDVVPGRYTEVFLQATEPGEYTLFCTEYCGTKHSDMLAKAIVHPAGEFETWLQQAANPYEGKDPVAAGELVFQKKGCTQCHSTDGTRMIGPTLKGLWGSERNLTDGTTVTADENYIKQSLTEPASQVVATYAPVMPSFQGKISAKELEYFIAYLKSIKE